MASYPTLSALHSLTSPTNSLLPKLPFPSQSHSHTLYSPPKTKTSHFTSLCTGNNNNIGYEVGGGYPETHSKSNNKHETKEQFSQKLDSSEYKAVIRGGEQVTSLLQEMITILEDMNMDEQFEKIAVELAAQGVIGKRVDEMEPGFMIALDMMIQSAVKDGDDRRKALLQIVKDTVLSHLTKKCPPHVQVVGLLCRTPDKDSRHELLRRVAGGGGQFKGENDTKVHLPGANLLDISNQADDLLETMETRPVVPDRKLLARLVLIREEARNMMGGGMLDERNDRGFTTLPQSEVNFLMKLVALKPGKTVENMIKNVMLGKDEGADKEESRRESTSSGKLGPVRPGMFLETVSKVLGEIYTGNVPGITAQHLEWESGNGLQISEPLHIFGFEKVLDLDIANTARCAWRFLFNYIKGANTLISGFNIVV